MDSQRSIKISNVPDEHQYKALQVARAFDDQFPDRIGIRNGCVYSFTGISIYAYRTKTQIVVRGNTSEQ